MMMRLVAASTINSPNIPADKYPIVLNDIPKSGALLKSSLYKCFAFLYTFSRLLSASPMVKARKQTIMERMMRPEKDHSSIRKLSGDWQMRRRRGSILRF